MSQNVLIEKVNSEVFLRPRFSIDLNKSDVTVLNEFSEEFKKEECKIRGKIVDGHVFISVPKDDEHFWSPQLHLEILEATANKSLLKGLFGPKPQVWTLFMFVHFIIGVSFLGFGASQFLVLLLLEFVTLLFLVMVGLSFLGCFGFFLMVAIC